VGDRGVYRGLYSALFDDPDYQRLSTGARCLLLTARQCSQAGVAAIFRYYPAVLAAQTGLSLLRVEAGLVELEGGDWIARDGPVLWVRNGLRYDPLVRLSDPKHRKGVIRTLAGLPKVGLVLKFCDYYEIVRPFGDPSETLRRPSSLWRSEEDPDSDSEEDPDSEKPSVSGSAADARRRLNGLADAEGVLNFLNQKTGRNFRARESSGKPSANLALIAARLAGGATVIQCRAIILRKYHEWKGDETMAKFLRPETLFGRSKFEQYLGELPARAEPPG